MGVNKMTEAAGLCVERHCEMRCERDALQDALRDAIEEMRQTLKLNTKDSIPGIATTRSIGLVNRQPASSYGLGAAKPRGQRLRGRSRCPETFRVVLMT